VAVLPMERLTVWNRTPARAEALVREVAPIVTARVAPALEPEVRRQRVIVTATASTAPLIAASWVAPGTHITSAGTGSPEKVELEPALLERADKLVADRRAQTERYGNLHHALTAGRVPRVYAELGDLAAGRLPGRQTPGEITITDLTGVGVQDAAIAGAVLEVLER
jgi:ornithine cyclodeaminase